jgi:DNA modification methylase
MRVDPRPVSAGVAAALEGRKFLGFETSANYFRIGQERLTAAIRGGLIRRVA